ncbi:TetR/AcrR family transcriptional regulator [Paenibacillus prosopidis]|uniref:TetR family transcriptional regulator n=1 Tax=Paenibacillus prosopidis TaxID=630520 RepID=A0A368VP07_9BACL|nr:TetR/AcrR family transcriptional regulator [Paenibacillus prosopidis]RCW43461.1 TetR family transcriptional regulator [Paenibacillus prosopidis]
MVGVKNNRRTQYTTDFIKRSFLALLETRKLTQITVTEICKQADINRGTFYLHYRDPYDLFEVMQKEFNREILETLQKDQSPCTVDGSIIKLLNIIQEKKTIYRIMISESGENNFLSEVLLEVHKDYLQRMGDDHNKKNLSVNDYSFTYMVHGSMGIINRWLESSGEESPRDIAHLISSLTQTTMNGNRERQRKFS